MVRAWKYKGKGLKVRNIGNRPQVRKVGHRNLTDKTAKSYGRKRKKGYYSSTDKGARGHRINRNPDIIEQIFGF